MENANISGTKVVKTYAAVSSIKHGTLRSLTKSNTKYSRNRGGGGFVLNGAGILFMLLGYVEISLELNRNTLSNYNIF